MKDLDLILQEYVATANNPEYNNDYDIINGKFPELKDIDPIVLQEYVATANNEDYNGDYDIINSKFPEFGIKSHSTDDSFVYEFRTEGNKGAWGKSTDGGVTFEVVNDGNIPDEWFEDPKFKNVYEQETGFKAEDFKKEPDNRGWFEQAMDAGAVNADLYDNADAIFDINNTKNGRELSDTELQAYIDLVDKSKTSAVVQYELT